MGSLNDIMYIQNHSTLSQVFDIKDSSCVAIVILSTILPLCNKGNVICCDFYGCKCRQKCDHRALIDPSA